MRVELFEGGGQEQGHGLESFIEFKSRRACTHCHLGPTLLEDWHIEGPRPCKCDYGWLSRQEMLRKASGQIQEIAVLGTCPTCSEGAALRLEMDRLIHEKRQERLNRLMAGGGITTEIAAKTFDNFTTLGNIKLAEVKNKVMAVANLGESLLLVGNPGQGKSHLAAAYLNHWIHVWGRTAAFVSLVDLMALLRRTIRADAGPDWDETLERYIAAELLVMDDLGQEKASEKVFEVVFHLLNSRINRSKPTVVTTNYSLKELTSDLGYPPSIASRLASFNRVAWVSEDYRLRVVDIWDRPGR